MQTLQQIKEYCIARGFNSRACRFKVISELVGISEEEAKASEKINRYIREIFPKDKVGAKKEAEWKMPYFLRNLDDELDKLTIRKQKSSDIDPIKFRKRLFDLGPIIHN